MKWIALVAVLGLLAHYPHLLGAALAGAVTAAAAVALWVLGQPLILALVLVAIAWRKGHQIVRAW